eukprot:COSAG06_NODE_4392_length_4305_cov_1.890157_2_plen_103_part_00
MVGLLEERRHRKAIHRVFPYAVHTNHPEQKKHNQQCFRKPIAQLYAWILSQGCRRKCGGFCLRRFVPVSGTTDTLPIHVGKLPVRSNIFDGFSPWLSLACLG